MSTMAAKRDYYEVLGVAREASGKDIAAAYRKLAIMYHPDSHPGDADATVKFKEAAAAGRLSSPPASCGCRPLAPPAREAGPRLPTLARSAAGAAMSRRG